MEVLHTKWKGRCHGRWCLAVSLYFSKKTENKGHSPTMIEKCFKKSRIAPVKSKTETTQAPPAAGHHAQPLLHNAFLDWRECKSAPCFANIDPVPFLAKTLYRDSNYGMGADFVKVVPFCHDKHASQIQQSIGRTGKKGYCLLSCHCAPASPPTLTHLLLPSLF